MLVLEPTCNLPREVWPFKDALLRPTEAGMGTQGLPRSNTGRELLVVKPHPRLYKCLHRRTTTLTHT